MKYKHGTKQVRYPLSIEGVPQVLSGIEAILAQAELANLLWYEIEELLLAAFQMMAVVGEVKGYVRLARVPDNHTKFRLVFTYDYGDPSACCLAEGNLLTRTVDFRIEECEPPETRLFLRREERKILQEKVIPWLERVFVGMQWLVNPKRDGILLSDALPLEKP